MYLRAWAIKWQFFMFEKNTPEKQLSFIWRIKIQNEEDLLKIPNVKWCFQNIIQEEMVTATNL